MKRVLIVAIASVAFACTAFEAKAQVPTADVSLQNAYEYYIGTKATCEIGSIGNGYDRLNETRQGLKEITDFSKESLGLDTDAIWQKAEANVSQNATYQLLIMARNAPLNQTDRVQFYNDCSNMITNMRQAFDFYIPYYGKGKAGIKKDF